MRVVAGKAKGKKLLSVPGQSTRPILDRVKTALFDILRPSITDSAFLDVFAGTGAVGIEALSQGAASCIFIDLNKKAYQTIKKNLELCKLEDQAEVRNTDAFSYLRNTRKSFDLIYIAPPQYQGIWIEIVYLLAEKPELLSPTGQAIVQIDPKEYEQLDLKTLKEFRQKRYGNTLLVFYQGV